MPSFGRNKENDPNRQLLIGGVGMTSVQGTGQTGIRTSAFKKAVLGNSKAAQSFPREGMNPVSVCLFLTFVFSRSHLVQFTFVPEPRVTRSFLPSDTLFFLFLGPGLVSRLPCACKSEPNVANPRTKHGRIADTADFSEIGVFLVSCGIFRALAHTWPTTHIQRISKKSAWKQRQNKGRNFGTSCGARPCRAPLTLPDVSVKTVSDADPPARLCIVPRKSVFGRAFFRSPNSIFCIGTHARLLKLAV
mmetsp:Transcript_50336/g.81298  ORF Transcript_50336/g.81298 Transcript_50336/m.81298 type:complete len:247 (+) Transcript_50336:355-1095(+)